jgi:UDP-N-acetylglucosamine/UDP-N-acetylgalactosamine diphosphorylase
MMYYSLVTKSQGEGREPPGVEIRPMINEIVKQSQITDEDRKRWLALGYNEIANGHVALLLMAGGQGTRLGCDDPKGMFDLGLLSGKTLYQIQAERILRLQQITAEFTGKKSVILPWYIMTSFATDTATREFFEKHNFFGLQRSQVTFFKQEEFPCITPEGKIMLESKCKIATAPNGNGGLFFALPQHGLLQQMEERGITWVSTYCVDNILVKVADPLFIGFCKEKGADCAAKVVAKAYPEEPVGVLCWKDNKPAVIEYSELDPSKAKARDENNQLVYNYAHIVLNDFSMEFLKRVTSPQLLHTLRYHIANKKIIYADEEGNPTVPTTSNGWKMELFIFDVFESAKNMVALEVRRDEEFSPLKNSEKISSQDNPRTCRLHLSRLHRRYIEHAGGIILDETPKKSDNSTESTSKNIPQESHDNSRENDRMYLCEISPLLTYAGEGLEPLVRGKTFKLPFYLSEKDVT